MLRLNWINHHLYYHDNLGKYNNAYEYGTMQCMSQDFIRMLYLFVFRYMFKQLILKSEYFVEMTTRTLVLTQSFQAFISNFFESEKLVFLSWEATSEAKVVCFMILVYRKAKPRLASQNNIVSGEATANKLDVDAWIMKRQNSSEECVSTFRQTITIIDINVSVMKWKYRNEYWGLGKETFQQKHKTYMSVAKVD